MLSVVPIPSRETLQQMKRLQLGARTSGGVSGWTASPRRHRPQSKQRGPQAFCPYSFPCLKQTHSCPQYSREKDRIPTVPWDREHGSLDSSEWTPDAGIVAPEVAMLGGFVIAIR